MENTSLFKILPKRKHNWKEIDWIAPHLVPIDEYLSFRKNLKGTFDESSPFNALFTGPSGTGKVIAAQLLGEKYDRDVYKINVPDLLSKFIGETEKNLDFELIWGAANSRILFFDEADALFGRRTKVKDSHDRYANQEVSYLLQRMEEYQGISIVAVKQEINIDAALLRRFAACIHFEKED